MIGCVHFVNVSRELENGWDLNRGVVFGKNTLNGFSLFVVQGVPTSFIQLF